MTLFKCKYFEANAADDTNVLGHSLPVKEANRINETFHAFLELNVAHFLFDRPFFPSRRDIALRRCPGQTDHELP